MAALKGIKTNLLDKYVDNLPIPIKQHLNRCFSLGDFLLSKILDDKDFIEVDFNKTNLLKAIYYHDIGKKEIPVDNILLKYCKTKDNKNIYYFHVDKGIEIIKKLLPNDPKKHKKDSFVYYLYQCVSEHHESINGKGYPGKLKDEQLSFAGRVCAVIDRFDNCMFVGKTSIDFKAGLKKFKEEASGNLDEKIVKLFIKDEENLEAYVNQIINKEQNRLKNNPYGIMMTYQPIINLSDKSEINLEAKILINDPYFGLIKPGLFIPIAEETNQINELLYLSLGRICRTVLKLNEKNIEFQKIFIHINTNQLLLPNFVQTISKTFDKYQVSADNFAFLITAKEEYSKSSFINVVLSSIKEMGIKIYLNDFGEQYATYDLLLKLPFDGVIISDTYTENLENNSRNLLIVKSMMQILKSFSLDVICVNISTQEEENTFKSLGCSFVQGEKYSLPINEMKLAMYLRRNYANQG